MSQVSSSYLDDLRDSLTCKKGGSYIDRIHILDSKEWRIEPRLATDDEIDNHRILPRDALTMIGTKGLDNIHYCIKQCIKNKVPGGFMETGVWRGGACIFAAGCFKFYNEKRPVYVCDSFEGLPLPSHEKDAGHEYYNEATYLKISQETVRKSFEKYNLLSDDVFFIEGYFEHTMSELAKEDFQLAVLRLDGDMYTSTLSVLENMYDKVSPGGYIIVDDFCLELCRQAVYEFRDKRKITDPILSATTWQSNGVSYPSIVFWKKSQ